MRKHFEILGEYILFVLIYVGIYYLKIKCRLDLLKVFDILVKLFTIKSILSNIPLHRKIYVANGNSKNLVWIQVWFSKIQRIFSLEVLKWGLEFESLNWDFQHTIELLNFEECTKSSLSSLGNFLLMVNQNDELFSDN